MTAATAIATSVPEEEEIEGVEIEQPEGSEQDDAAQAAIEARARSMGWHPFAEYNGPPGKWVDAATFVERGENILPIVRAQNHRLEERVKKLGDIIEDQGRTISEQRQVLEEMRTLARTSDERGYKRAHAELTAARDAAEEAGDIKTFKQIDEQIDELEETRAAVAPKPSTEPPPVPRQQEVDPAIAAFAKAHKDWWNKDQAMSQYMIAAHNAVIAESPEMPLAEQLDLAVEDVKRRFPHRFSEEDTPVRQPPRRAASVATPTARPAPSSRTASGLDSIADPAERAEAKAAYAKFKRQMPDMTESEYLTLWNDPRADIIAIRRAKKENPNARA